MREDNADLALIVRLLRQIQADLAAMRDNTAVATAILRRMNGILDRTLVEPQEGNAANRLGDLLPRATARIWPPSASGMALRRRSLRRISPALCAAKR
jgi:hypothetical protein